MIALPRLLVLTVVTSACWAKLCCDQECKKPVSYGRTKDRYITQEAGHLSFPNAAIVTILIKQAEFDSSGQELWFAEIQGRKGLVPAQVVTELHTLCEPKELSDDHLDGHGNTLHYSPPPPPSHTPYDASPPHIHQSGEPDSQTDVVLEQKQGPSRNNPVDQDREQLQTYSEHDDLDYGSPEEEPNNQELKEEKRNFNEDYMSNENQITQNGDLDSSDNDQYGVEYNEHLRDEWTSYSVYHDSYDRQQIETHDQPSQTMEAISAPSSTLAPESISGTGESPNSESLLPPQDIDSGERNFDQTPSSELGESSQAPLDKDVFNQEEQNQPESNSADKEKFGVPPSFNFQTLDETTASEVYSAGSSSNGIADYETPSAKGVPDEASSEHFDAKKVIPSYTSYETWSTGGVESVIEHTLTQDSPFHTPTSSYESHPGGEEPILVNLRNGESVRVVPLGGGNFQIKAEDGSVRLVDYDYFDDQGVEFDFYDRYADAGPDTEREVMEIEENSPPKQILPENEVPIYTEVNEGYPAYDKELLPSHEAEDMPGYTPSPTKTGENHRHHSYLDVHSLQQRYKQTNTFEEDDTNNMKEVISEILNEQTSANIKFTSTEDAQLRKTENLQVLNTPLASRDTEQGRVGETNKQTFEDTTLLPLPDIERRTQPVSTSEEPEVKVHPQPTSQLFPDDDLEDDLKATHLPLPDVEQVSQQHESTRGQQQLPSLEHLPPENRKTTSTPIHTNVKSQEESDPQMPVINIVAQFSPQLAAWINDQGPEFGIIGVIASALCLILPLCCSCCHYWKDSRRKTLTLSKYTASRKGLEEQIEKLKAEKKSLNVERLLSEERFESLQNELEHMKYDNQTLTEAKVDIEENYGNVCAELHTLKQELSACTVQVNQIQSELKHERLQMCAQTSEKEVALQQIALLQNEMRLYDQKVQELEAAKEQLEQDSYSTHNRFQELEELHKQVTEELAGSKSENAELNSRLQALQVEVSSLQQTRNDNNQEIQTLKDCLDQLVVSTGSHEQQEMTDGQTQNVNSTGTLLKIQAMLDTTKVQAELQAVTVERDNNIAALEEQSRLVKKLQEENTNLLEHSNEIEAQLSVCTADLQKLQEKHKTLTEYFEQKEHNLHRMLGAEEAVRQAVESREAQVKEKAQSLEQAETRHREELKQLRSEMFEIEKSLMSQVHTCQKRAEDAIAEQRRLEQECKALKMERDDLRKRMTVKSVSPVGGASDRQHSLIARPPSAPYLPRTSSPGVGDTGNYMTSLLNQTDPGPLPSTRPQPIFPITGRPEPSPFFPPPDQRGHFPPSQPPLQHPIPERERPRYPLPPPPGRRLIRGYPPPFERRPPRPGVYGPGPRFYHDARDRVPERRRPLSNPPPGATPTPPVGVYDPHTSRNMHDSSTGFVPVAPAVPETTFQTDNVLNPVGEQVPLQRPESRKF